ncbi:E3 ubiquitin-protein ligase TRIM39-like [Cololabis saira]|uniref:E3 ubiquitin-protein ligase TRIM39-like n=1 Tax=Cololabis saira TaxID=129043 RepID=UPI002AD4C0DB|nr:E3 ubiquitin-protein ligase TRIM39-like [Cololabis saira]
MATNSLLSEEQFLCPICLDVFKRPVSTPCGHNFCMVCLTCYWDDARVCQCPVCKEQFQRRPDLKVNTFISEMASQFMSLNVTNAENEFADQQQGNCGDVVLCDICTETQREAAKSCLECLSSYCNDHLEPHHRASGLRRHTLVGPVPNLEDRVCKRHNRLLILFCRDDSALLCNICASSNHINHDVIPIQQAYDETKDLLEKSEVQVQRMIQERTSKVQNTRDSVVESKTGTEGLVASSIQDLEDVVLEINRIQVELITAVEEKQKSAEEEAEGFIGVMTLEISELQATAVKLRELKQTKDWLGFLQNPSLLPYTMDLSAFNFNTLLGTEPMRTFLTNSFSQLRALLSKISSEISHFSGSSDMSDEAKLRYMQQYEVNVTLDAETAHPMLSLSPDGKQVSYTQGSSRNVALRPGMFNEHLAVLGRTGFSSCKFYFEVYVGQKTEWCLGVATASIQRTGAVARSSFCGLWALWLLKDKLETFSSPGVVVHLGRVERIGVFVDYDGGQISFYDVGSAAPIYSFNECLFTEELYPYFNPCDNEYGSNLDPLIIVPVSITA